MNLQENLLDNAQFTYFKSIIIEKIKFKNVVRIIKVAKPKFNLWHMQKNMNQYNYLVNLYLVKNTYKIK